MRRCVRRTTWVLGLAATLALAIGGCAVAPRAADVPGDMLAGRLAVRVEGIDGGAARSVSAAFELQGNAESGRLNLSTPLGSTLAQARWSPGSVLLVTPQGERRFADLDALTREVLGEALPVAALFDWLRGRPWPGAPSQAQATPGETVFAQLGWTVDLARIGDSWVTARRDSPPVVTVRAKIDAP